jgi:hypothetical protein
MPETVKWKRLESAAGAESWLQPKAFKHLPNVVACGSGASFSGTHRLPFVPTWKAVIISPGKKLDRVLTVHKCRAVSSPEHRRAEWCSTHL